MTIEEMVKQFQCPGCVRGSAAHCDARDVDDTPGGACRAHVSGTSISTNSGLVNFMLGLPRGFCRARRTEDHRVRFWPAGTHPSWNFCNVPVWALDGQVSKDPDHPRFLFVRTVCPRVDWLVTDVVEGGTLEMVPGAVDMAAHMAEID